MRSPELLEGRLVALLDARLRERGVGGLAIARGAVPETCVAWLPESLPQEPAFLIYSVTKTFTATLALQLQEEGRLSLDDSLVHWLPDVPGSQRIPIRALLNHSAGVPDYGALGSYHDAVRRAPGDPWSFEEFARHTWQHGLLFDPGAGWAYSNPGYLLVKRVLEQVAERSYADLVESRICRRLELARTFVPESSAGLAALAPANSTLLSPTQQPRDVRLAYHPGWVSHGVVASTPSELARFLHALFSEQIVGRASLRELTTLVPVPKGPPRWRKPSYGLGVMADPESPWGPVFGHGGGGPGYNASVFHASSLAPGGATVCALCASEEDFPAESLALDAFDLLRGGPEALP